MILLTGSTGYVGGAFRRHLSAQCIPHTAPPRTDSGDLAVQSNVERLLDLVRPTAVINAAGWPGSPNVDATTSQPVRCIASNLLVPLVLARACNKRRIPLGHVSTGCVYFGDGPDGTGFAESDAPNFGFWSRDAGLYSRCKDLADKSIALICPAAWLWRLRMPFDHRDNPRNYLGKLLRYPTLLEARNSISHLDDFAATCVASIRCRVPFGAYNLTNPGSVATSEITAMLREFGVVPASRQWNFFTGEEEFLQSAARVRRAICTLRSDRIGRAGLPMRPIRDALRAAMQQWTSDTACANEPGLS